MTGAVAVRAVEVRWADRSDSAAAPDRRGARHLRRATGRALVSELVAGTGVSADSLVRAPGRAPRLVGGEFFVSLSHSAHLTVCAISTEPVGVDIEIADTDRAGRLGATPPNGWFTERERTVLAAEPHRVLELFTVKEAWAKRLGTGLDSRLGSIDAVAALVRDPAVRFTSADIPGAVCTVCHGRRLAVRVRQGRPGLDDLARAARLDAGERGRA